MVFFSSFIRLIEFNVMMDRMVPWHEKKEKRHVAHDLYEKSK